MPSSGISSVIEQCFNDGHLSFYGEIKWIREVANGNRWNGTYPKNSEWTKIVTGEKPNTRHCAHKDLVWVPENLKPGEYICFVTSLGLCKGRTYLEFLR